MRIRTLAAVAAAAGVAFVGTALPANAEEKNGKCGDREACLYYNGNRDGSLTDYYFPDKDLAGDKFLSSGAGKGQNVKNNAASAWNRDSTTLRIYYNENYTGPYDSIPAEGWENLVNTWNDNASLKWL